MKDKRKKHIKILAEKIVKAEKEILLGKDVKNNQAKILNIMESLTFEEMFELDMRRARDGWYLLDTYGITGDTLVVRLTDKSELGMITADAVKIVKK